ncbi:MAG: hypothetical protein JNL62_17925 [Bryobacterales bacterium]|nr:hypothetical protein [Bryobacterales bacterium]
MKHQHISEWLDQREPGAWTPQERAAAELHAAHCPECRNAWAAAQTARALLQARARLTVAPPPHFATALMRSIDTPSLPLALRLWRANSRLIYTTAAAVALLTVLALREEFALRSREYSDAAIEAASVAAVHDIAMGGSDEDAVSN